MIDVTRSDFHTTQMLDRICSDHPPLSAEQERRLIDGMKNTDRSRLNDLLVLHNVGFAVSVAKKYAASAPRFVDADDYIQDAIAGLSQAALKFDTETGVRFCSYAGYWVGLFCRRYTRSVSSLTDVLTSVSRDDNYRGNDRTVDHVLTSISMLDVDDDPDILHIEQSLDKEVVDALIHHSRKITEKQRGILRLMYISGMNSNAVAREIGMTRQGVEYSEADAMRHVMRFFAPDYKARIFGRIARYGSSSRGLVRDYGNFQFRRCSRLVRKGGQIYKVEWRISGGGGAYFADLQETEDQTCVKRHGVDENELREVHYNCNVLKYINGKWTYVRSSNIPKDSLVNPA